MRVTAFPQAATWNFRELDEISESVKFFEKFSGLLNTTEKLSLGIDLEFHSDVIPVPICWSRLKI